jgi:preprotein translocase subunit SecD
LHNGRVLSVPRINSIIGDRAQISSNFTNQEARLLADTLNARGDFPVPVTFRRIAAQSGAETATPKSSK